MVKELLSLDGGTYPKEHALAKGSPYMPISSEHKQGQYFTE